MGSTLLVHVTALAATTTDSTAVWVAVLLSGLGALIVATQIPVSDPTATRLVGKAVLSLYAHGGVGSYRLRYLRGDELLAEGTFELVP